MKRLMIMLAATLLAGASAAAIAAPADVAAAVAAPGRTPDNVKLDEARKPLELLNFIGLEPGMRVIDMFGANRYWAELIAPAVGASGHVVVWQPSQFLNDKRRSEFAEFAGRQGNVLLLTTPFETPIIGTGAYDFMIMNLDYHDVYLENSERKIVRMDPDAWLKRLYDAMKPGAVVGIIDHAANPGGDTRAIVKTLHRIDPAVVRADFERAGFVTEGTSDILRNPADDRTSLVFDEKIRGKTDRFVFRFRKPR
ncbi:MAG: class I SAM-dependent methyltransferase [Sphingomonas sp.]|nr:class I SAM-dependent methyltransferase [Sphingomonas sp.]